MHANLVFSKYDSISKYIIQGGEFRLSGTSDYGNQVVLYSTSDSKGKVSFSNVELGTYELSETKAADGYIKMKNSLTVRIQDPGVAFLYNGSQEGAKTWIICKQ